VVIMPLSFDPASMMAPGGVIAGLDNMGAAVTQALSRRAERRYGREREDRQRQNQLDDRDFATELELRQHNRNRQESLKDIESSYENARSVARTAQDLARAKELRALKGVAAAAPTPDLLIPDMGGYKFNRMPASIPQGDTPEETDMYAQIRAAANREQDDKLTIAHEKVRSLGINVPPVVRDKYNNTNVEATMAAWQGALSKAIQNGAMKQAEMIDGLIKQLAAADKNVDIDPSVTDASLNAEPVADFLNSGEVQGKYPHTVGTEFLKKKDGTVYPNPERPGSGVGALWWDSVAQNVADDNMPGISAAYAAYTARRLKEGQTADNIKRDEARRANIEVMASSFDPMGQMAADTLGSKPQNTRWGMPTGSPMAPANMAPRPSSPAEVKQNSTATPPTVAPAPVAPAASAPAVGTTPIPLAPDHTELQRKAKVNEIKAWAAANNIAGYEELDDDQILLLIAP
jgi:hypothetical protein